MQNEVLHRPANRRLQTWVDEIRSLCDPRRVIWCDGSREQYDRIWNGLVGTGAARRLNPILRPDSFIVRSDPIDVARVEDRTFICSESRDDAGP
ncbi:MAG: phosphoenolpyruvate carboxykinase (GTP), partial [Burkholderiales bacterium]